jgi:hypothetical protein
MHTRVRGPGYRHQEANRPQRVAASPFLTDRPYMDGEEIKVYPIDVFAQILFEKATQYQILHFLKGAINRTKARM